MSKTELSEKELAILSLEMDKRGKKPVLAWLLWWFLGLFGGHKFYLGEKTAGIVYLVVSIISYILLIVLVGLVGLLVIGVLWIIDAVKLQGKIAEVNEEIEKDIINEIISTRRD